jgi:hypothetical protein
MAGAQRRNGMASARENDIKLLVAKFVKLVESLEPGERLSIKKVAAKKGRRTGSKRKTVAKAAGTKRQKMRKQKTVGT